MYICQYPTSLQDRQLLACLPLMEEATYQDIKADRILTGAELDSVLLPEDEQSLRELCWVARKNGFC